MMQSMLELFKNNLNLDTEKRKELVQGLEEYLTFDDIFTKPEVLPADFSSVLSKYGWFWVSCGKEQLVVNDVTNTSDKATAQLSYLDTGNGRVQQINFTDFMARVQAANASDELAYAAIRLLESPAEGAKPKIPDPLQFYTTDQVNGKNRIERWRETIAALASEEFVFWAADKTNPDAARNTENQTFVIDENAPDPLMSQFKEVMTLGLLSQEYAHYKDLIADETKSRKKGSPALSEEEWNELHKNAKHARSLVMDQEKNISKHFPKLNAQALMKSLLALSADHPSPLRFLQRMLLYTNKSQDLAWSCICDLTAWSAHFITYIMKQSMIQVESEFAAAGLPALEKKHFKHLGFRYGGAHRMYFTEALVNRLNRDYSRPFWLFRLNEMAVEKGDIIVKARPADSIDFDLKMPERVKLSGSTWIGKEIGQESHADLVVDVVTENGSNYAITIGGNTRDLTGAVNTVGKKKYLLDADGKVLHEVDINNVGPSKDHSAWAIIKIIDKLIVSDWNAANTDKVDVYEQLFGIKKKALSIQPKP